MARYRRDVADQLRGLSAGFVPTRQERASALRHSPDFARETREVSRGEVEVRRFQAPAFNPSFRSVERLPCRSPMDGQRQKSLAIFHAKRLFQRVCQAGLAGQRLENMRDTKPLDSVYSPSAA